MDRMQKKILVMRHAKSSWDHPNLRDFDRPLNKRGNRDAPAMGRYLKELGLSPHFIVSSTANRAATTVRLLSTETGFDPKVIVWDESLYFEGASAYIRAIEKAPEEASVVLVAGHYPMVHHATSLLIEAPVNDHFATASIACIGCDASNWKEISNSNNRLLWFMSPKKLPKKE